MGCYVSRSDEVIWRDIAGEVVIVGENDCTIRMLNETASYIWLLADGTRLSDEIAAALSQRFEVAPEEAQADVDQFCSELLEANLATASTSPREH